MVDGGALVKEVLSLRKQPELCELEGIASCTVFKFNVAALGDKKIHLKPMLNQTFTLDKTVEDSRNVYYYTSTKDSSDLVLTFNNFYGGTVHGKLRTTSVSYSIEFLQYSGIHVFKQFAQEEQLSGIDFMDSFGKSSRVAYRSNTCANHKDELTTVYIKFYFTINFASVTPDVNGFIQDVVENLNIDYSKEGIPIRVKALCSEMAPISEDIPANEALEIFMKMKGTVAKLHGGADSSVLLAKSFKSNMQQRYS